MLERTVWFTGWLTTGRLGKEGPGRSTLVDWVGVMERLACSITGGGDLDMVLYITRWLLAFWGG